MDNKQRKIHIWCTQRILGLDNATGKTASGEFRNTHRQSLGAPGPGRSLEHTSATAAAEDAMTIVGKIPVRQLVPIPTDQQLLAIRTVRTTGGFIMHIAHIYVV